MFPQHSLMALKVKQLIKNGAIGVVIYVCIFLAFQVFFGGGLSQLLVNYQRSYTWSDWFAELTRILGAFVAGIVHSISKASLALLILGMLIFPLGNIALAFLELTTGNSIVVCFFLCGVAGPITPTLLWLLMKELELIPKSSEKKPE